MTTSSAASATMKCSLQSATAAAMPSKTGSTLAGLSGLGGDCVAYQLWNQCHQGPQGPQRRWYGSVNK